jgi:hypothetical protein
MKKAFVIMCNDSIEFVVIGDTILADIKMIELKKKHRDRLLKEENFCGAYDFIFHWNFYESEFIEY